MTTTHWIMLLGLGGVAYYAYRELNRTKTVYVDSFNVPGVPNIIAAVA